MATLSTQSITKIGVAAIAINGLIGAGIFALPAAAANQLAYFSPWMFLLCGIAIFPIVACFAILSSAFDQTGGPVLYSTKAFGPFVGFQTGWLLYLGRVSALAANGHALVLYLSLYFPVLQTPEIASIGVCLLIVLLATINILGIKNAMTSIYLVTLAKLLPIALFVLFGVTYINAEQLFSAPPPQLDQFPTSMLLLVYAFIGFEGAIIPAKEAKNPKADMPKALLLTLIATTVLYFFIQAIVVSTLPTPIATNAPLVTSANVITESLGITSFGLVIAFTAIVSIFGNLLALMLAAPRMTYALAENNQLPQWFLSTHKRYLTPINSIYFLAGFAMILAITKGFVWLAIFSSLARLIGYLVCVLAVPKLHKKMQLPLSQWVIFLISSSGILVCVWLIAQASIQSWLYTLGFILLGSIFYRVARVT
ncbi:APC family permease [Psychrosphaera sp. B3R10]|uniref:APC family permease n=1 Tax=unclassified Psychrosphaera TaxID=2641570 RepID=UPI001C09203E|nr:MULTISPECIES: APC family permease [unclassified Psychrosphaera]MBU2883261.1 APC family permease [Psychrosphaera sp. I2R16]MBU2990645.1 APC family permease [Psychrosphaera sp. B3R10]